MPRLCTTIKRLLPLACCCLLLNLLLPDDRQREGHLENTRQKEGASKDRNWNETLGNRRQKEKVKLGDDKLSGARVEDERDRGQWVRERLREEGTGPASRHSSLDGFERPDSKGSILEFPQSVQQSSGASPVQGDKSENVTAPLNHPRSVEEALPLWMRVSDDLYAYSAFWDARQGLPTGPAVRVLGILRYAKDLTQESPGQRSGVVREEALRYSCFLWYTGQGAEEGRLRAFIYEEGWKTFVGTYFLCSPKNVTSNSSSPRHDEGRVPYAVSLVPQGADSKFQRLVYLSTGNQEEQGHGAHSGAVCVRPLFGPYTNLAAIALFISYYSTVLDVSHFYFYDFAIDRNVKEFLLHLMAGGDVIIHLLAWNIPTSEWEELWDLGSLTAINDCVYRASGKHGHLAIVDMDEFIVPRAAIASLGQLYSDVIKHKRGSEGDSILILNAFFCSEFQEKTSGGSKDFPIFQATLREPRLWPPKSRSKMVVVPRAVVSVGHHMVHHFLLPASKNQASPKLVSVLHHYRDCAGVRTGIHAKGSEVVKRRPMTDKTILKYKKAVLASRVMSQYRHFTLGAQ
ncbi:uncharacterized protein LOC126982717 [Eriocheir sinensis]|uniref:uncharacterized protein LOC126982717 n=1 Tax=Eriocheir sinensis TaxID=95602 RepID=UPI0021C5B40D|nr:uncharacterized protein LOC126982717 [Eriocheir sinensis]